MRENSRSLLLNRTQVVRLGRWAFCAAAAAMTLGGSDCLAEPAAGVRVEIRDHRQVASPAEELTFAVTADLPDAPDGAQVVAQIAPIGSADVVWQSTVELASDAGRQPILFTAPAPTRENAYQFGAVVRPPEQFVDRMRPFHRAASLGSARVEFAVIDPAAQLPRLLNEWTEETVLDLANPGWWQQLPAWTRWPALTGGAGPVSSNRTPQVRATPAGEFLELPPNNPGSDPGWIAIRLPIRKLGLPHAVELQLPAGAAQDLAVSVREADELAEAPQRFCDAGLLHQPHNDAAEGVVTHRVEFWPRTALPVLVIANRSADHSLTIGKVRILRQVVADATDGPGEAAKERLALAYISDAEYSGAFGVEGSTATSWQACLHGAQRLAQSVRAAGYNGAIVRVSGQHFATSQPSPVAQPTAGTAATTDSPEASDVPNALEALLRVFDREGLVLVPAIELSGRLAAVDAETERAAEEPAPQVAGLLCVDHEGRTWQQSRGDADAVAETNPLPRYNLLNPNVQRAVRSRVTDVAKQCEGRRCYGGLAVQITGDGYGALPGLAWCLDDATTERFCEATGIKLPSSHQGNRFRARAAQLLGPHAAAWTNWRSRQLARFYGELAAELPSGSHGAKIVFCVEGVYDGLAVRQRLRQALAGKCSVLAATDEAGLDLRALAEIPGAVLLRPQWLADSLRLEQSALDELASSSVEIEDALSGAASVGEMLAARSRQTPLAGLSAALVGSESSAAAVIDGMATAVGDRATAALARALARRDCSLLAIGGPTWPATTSDAARETLTAYRKLPPVGAETRLQRVPPVAMRVYRTAGATTACLVNSTPWPIVAKLPLVADDAASWRALSAEADSAVASGTLPPGPSDWNVTLPPYAVATRQWQSPRVRLGTLEVSTPGAAVAALRAELAAVETRMTRLDQRRSYPAMTNADFELATDDGAAVGWQPRIATRGAVAVDCRVANGGERSLHLVSADALGVAAQSEAFAGPDTGRLTVSARVRGLNFHPETRLYAGLEFENGGAWQRRYQMVLAKSTGNEWALLEFDADDLPLDGASVRVQFHLTGPGEAWIDDVQLFDVRFTSAERIDLAKRFFAAKLALQEGKLSDCQQMLAGYWPRYLLHHVPAEGPLDAVRSSELRIADTDKSPEELTPATEPPRRRLTDRVRELAPRLWR